MAEILQKAKNRENRPKRGPAGFRGKKERRVGLYKIGLLRKVGLAEHRQHVQEHGDDDTVEEVDEQRTDQRHDEESLRSGTKLLGQSLHVGHGVGGSAHTEAAESGNHDGGLIVTAHDVEHHEAGEERLNLLMVDPRIPAGAKLY